MNEINKAELTKQLEEYEMMKNEYEDTKKDLSNAKWQMQEANKQNMKIKQDILYNYNSTSAKQKAKEIDVLIEKTSDIINKQTEILTGIDLKLTEIKVKIDEIKGKLLAI